MVDQKELGIMATADIEDAKSNISDLSSLIEGLPDKFVEISANIDTTGLENFDAEVETSVAKLGDIGDASEAISSKIDDIGDSAISATDIVTVEMGKAEDSILKVRDTAEDTATKTSDLGEEGADAGADISDSMDEAAITIAAIAASAELSAQKINDMARSADKLSNYTGMSTDKVNELVTSMSSASFPSESVTDYLNELMQLGVTNDLLEKNARALNEVTLGTESAASEGTSFAEAIKVLGGDIEDFTAYLGLAGYAEKNTVGGLEGFDRIARAIGPKLTDMGLDAYQSAIIIGEASQKYGGNMRLIRKAIVDAHGDSNKLVETLGMQPSALENASEKMAPYADIVEKTAEKSKEAHTPLEQFYQDLKDVGFWGGTALAQLLSIVGAVGAVVGGIFLITKASDKLGVTQSANAKYVTLLKDNLGKFYTTIKDVFTKSASEATKAGETMGDAFSSSMGKAETTVSEGVENIIKYSESGYSRIVPIYDKFGNQIGETMAQIGPQIEKEAPGLERSGSMIPEWLGSGIASGATKLLSKAGLPLAILTLAIQGIYDYRDNLERSPIEFILHVGGLDAFIPKEIKDFLHDITGWLSPMSIMSALIGSGNAQGLATYIEGTFTDPAISAMNGFFDYIKGVPGQISTLTPGGIWAWMTGGLDIAVMTLTNLPGAVDSALINLPSILDNYINHAMFDLGSFAKTLYELPGQAYTSLVNLPTVISSGFNGVVLTLEGMPGRLYVLGQNAYLGLAKGVQDIDSYVGGAVLGAETYFNGLIAWGTGLPGTLYKMGSDAFNGFVNGIIADYNNIGASITHAEQIIDADLKYIWDLPGNMYNWGANTINSWIKGLSDGVESAKGWLNDKLGWFMQGWESHSPPTEGPLKDIDKWGFNLSGTYIGGIMKGLSQYKGIISGGLSSIGVDFRENLSGNLNLPNSTIQTINTPTQSQQSITNHFTITVQVDASKVDKDTADEVGNKVGKGVVNTIADDLLKDIISHGGSVVNIIR